MMAPQSGTSGQLFPTGVVGSMPRPQFLHDLLDPRAEGHTPPDVYAWQRKRLAGSPGRSRR